MIRPRTSRTLIRVIALLLALGASAASAQDTSSAFSKKIGRLARQRAAAGMGQSRVIVRAVDAASVSSLRPIVQQAGGAIGRKLSIINGYVADVPNAALAGLANSPLIEHIALDRAIVGAMERTRITIGAAAVRDELGYDGTGIGVAIIDSGVTAWHDDLSGAGGGQRVDRFVDFVNQRDTAYDDYGHGTHVAGIVAGNGFDSDGRRSGIAPGAHLIVLKTLDASGRGYISDVIAALDYVIANKDTLNIRVVNLSVATGVYDSYNADPLTLAAKRAVEAGIVVVAAAGNDGHNLNGGTQYGGVTAPGNAPWVLTVGAFSHMGTVRQRDDTIASFSSRGPTAIDYTSKPDVVAPGVGIESLSDPNSSLYTAQSQYLLTGSVPMSYLPYLSLSGTSMAAPVVSGTVALMLQANPALTPNQVKAIVQYTARLYSGYGPLTEGAGFLNAKGAVELALAFATSAGPIDHVQRGWSQRLIWGNQMIRGGRLSASANAWLPDVTWGAATRTSAENIQWGVICAGTDCQNDPGAWPAWETSCADAMCSTVTWSNGPSQNVVWGLACGGSDCPQTWTGDTGLLLFDASDSDTVVWGTGDSDTVVWGTGDSDTVVWGTNDADTVVWGTFDGDTVVWGTSDSDTVVWGTGCTDSSCEPVIWGDH
jgi:serine protease AprX